MYSDLLFAYSEINRLIRTFDTGVSDIHIEETDIDELEKTLPQPVFKTIINKLISRHNETPNVPAHISGRSNTAFFSIELSQEGDVKVKTIKNETWKIYL